MEEVWTLDQPGDTRIAKRCGIFPVMVAHYLTSGVVCALVTGYNHSGTGGQVIFLQGVTGFANAERALECIRVFTEFIFSQLCFAALP